MRTVFRNRLESSFFISVIFIVLLVLSCKKDSPSLSSKLLSEENAASSSAEILQFRVFNEDFSLEASINGDSLFLAIPFGMQTDSLKTDIRVSEGAKVEPDSGTVLNLNNQVPSLHYKVTAEDETTVRNYELFVEQLPNTQAEIIIFVFAGLDPVVEATIEGRQITATVPFGTDRVSLVPTIELSAGAIVSPASGAAQDFSGGPVEYIVTAADGATQQNYSASVTEAPNTQAEITSFVFAGLDPIVETTIEGSSITATVPFGTDRASLVPTIELSAGAIVSPASGAAQDFSGGPVEYTVTAADGVTESVYSVRVSEAQAEANIIRFAFEAFSPAIEASSIPAGGGVIELSVPFGANLGNLRPTIEVSPQATINPASGVVQDFSNNAVVEYVVTSVTNEQSFYSVSVDYLPNTDTQIQSFVFEGLSPVVEAEVLDNQITADIPHGTNLAQLRPTIRLPFGASISPASDQIQDFNQSVTYTVTAEDGTTKQTYQAVINQLPNSEANITAFQFENVEEVVSTNIREDSIIIVLHDGVNRSNLTPIIDISEDADISPASWQPRNFSRPVTYQVTSEDGISQKTYTVLVVIDPVIKEFVFENISSEQEVIINDGIITVSIFSNNEEDLTDLSPSIILSEGATINPPSGVEQDFSEPITYTVTSEFGVSKKEYEVTAIPNTTTNSIGMEFVYVAPGSFQMGSNTGNSDERPVHEVEITQGYYIGKYEVTQGQWQEVMGSNPSYFQASRVGSGHLNHPVEQVGWNQIRTFVQRLNEREGGNVYRLLTEAEWEYAARGGQQSQGYTYSGSNDVNEVAWYGSNSGTRTHPVGTKAPNELGIYDMSGNVLEWVNDWYSSSYYSQSPRQDPQGPSSGSSRVLRGGDWGEGSFRMRVAYRSFGSPTNGYASAGFRLLRAVD